ncbi:hypothetical protein A6770_32240 [Nostoc minutum NIES-26]|uniref:Uncharacterized protein n=1 Tax=Nostoc minutum NIES-26 TaxID=1844469 RepID=A0A367Q7H9_9NOSO|nr:hypothetical protein A6770_32240 [Nostoc minutum NIES-26]
MPDKFTNNVRARLYKQGYQGFTKDDYTSAALAVECDDLNNPTKEQLTQAVEYLKAKATSQLSVTDEPVEETFLAGAEDAQPEPESSQLAVASPENQIVLTEQQKQALVTEIASGAGIELKAADVKLLTVSIASTFASRKELNEAIFNALVHFAKEFKNQEVSKMGGRRDTCKLGHVVNNYCREALVDLLTCPKMIKEELNFCTVNRSFHLFLSLTLAHKWPF